MVKPMMKRMSETSIRMMPAPCPPGVPERIACGG